MADGDNRENWEKLCCSNRPLVPFFGAGISAWCYPTWNNLLKDIVEKVYSPQCAENVQEALDCKICPKFDSELKKPFRWMEEIAECIFETCEKDYKEYMEIFKQRLRRSALDFYQKYPEQYRLQEAGVLRNMADLYCRMGKGEMCYQVLEEAYLYYRSYNNLHGIADILQSMGEMEDFTKGQPAVGRSGLCFYKAAAKLYRTLGDGAIM